MRTLLLTYVNIVKNQYAVILFYYAISIVIGGTPYWAQTISATTISATAILATISATDNGHIGHTSQCRHNLCNTDIHTYAV